jgi:hypothetical protein
MPTIVDITLRVMKGRHRNRDCKFLHTARSALSFSHSDISNNTRLS